ncbi:MAG TPA: hypothetical protein VG869_16305 [Acidimicrobiia bacterium]|jgi:hypothetical protein|nr:hypothetical protein [Acidimicrobiia bacterium]
MLKRAPQSLALTAAGGAAAVVALLVGASHQVLDLVVIGTALVVGDLFDLRPAGRASIPVGFAVVVVLLRAATPREFITVIFVTAVVAAALRAEPQLIGARVFLLTEILTAGLLAGAVFRVILGSTSANSRIGVLSALAGAAIAQILVIDLVAFQRDHRLAAVGRRGADVAVVTSGILMAVGYGGLGGQGRLGLWGPLLFSIPLFAAWYSFELLRRTRRTFRQTVRALGIAPELGGLTRSGHIERVATLSVSLGQELGVTAGQLEDLETAAWLHHLGAVCIDDPTPGEQPDAMEVARAGAKMLRTSHALASAGDIVASEPSLHRPPHLDSEPASALLGQILKVASAYDELTEGDDAHASWAVEALFTGPAYVYDGRVLTALERVLSKRGHLSR